jgi:hypothetical protein
LIEQEGKGRKKKEDRDSIMEKMTINSDNNYHNTGKEAKEDA